MEGTEKITESEFHNKLQLFYNQLVGRTGVAVQTGRLNVANNAQRIEYVFIHPFSGQRGFLWWNKLTGLVGWGVIEPEDIV